MPIPWRPNRPSKKHLVDNVAERALTLRQLKDIRIFLQRLCKARLLRHTTAFAEEQGRKGLLIRWGDINLYDVADEVIKKLIPYLDDQERDDRRPGQSWYSWAEMVADGPQPAGLMISHWWGGRFRDFMAVVDHLEEDRGLCSGMGIWVCTFALCQFGQDMGTSICQCPFVHAVDSASATIMIVDRDAGALTRSWCCLELYHTSMQDKDFELYTPSGLVGSQRVSSGPLVEAVTRWDVRRSEASEASFRRQILNYIAGEPETSGLKVRPDGSLLVCEGRPQLEAGDDEPRQPGYARRRNGEEEFAHESALFGKNGEAFEDLNMQVRLSVMSKIGLPKRTTGCRISQMQLRGITLGQLRQFTRKAKRACREWSVSDSSLTWETMTVHMLNERLVKPATANHWSTGDPSCSYVELVASEPQVPRYYIAYSFTMTYCDVALAIEWFAEAKGLSDNAVFFFSLLSYNPHDVRHGLRCTTRLGSDGGLGIDRAQQECRGLLKCLNTDPAAITRGWSMYNLECAARLGQDVYFSCRTGVMACTTPFERGGWVFGSFCPKIASVLADVDFQSIQTSHPEDKAAINAFFQQSGAGFCDRFRNRLRRWSAGPLLIAAAVRGSEATGSGTASDGGVADVHGGDASEEDRVIGTPGLSVNSDMLKGELGETALHVAASLGNLRFLRKLLFTARMDPNCTDLMQERPLHYAALGGQAEAARLLLEAGADPYCESVFGETAIEVAAQNPAGFLGVCCDEVHAVLEEAFRKLKARKRQALAVPDAFEGPTPAPDSPTPREVARSFGSFVSADAWPPDGM